MVKDDSYRRTQMTKYYSTYKFQANNGFGKSCMLKLTARKNTGITLKNMQNIQRSLRLPHKKWKQTRHFQYNIVHEKMMSNKQNAT